MYRVTITSSNAYRLTSAARLGADEFRRIANEAGLTPATAVKIGYVAARPAGRKQVIVTHWNGEETTAMAEPGDMIVTNLVPAKDVLTDRAGKRNVYVIKAARFPELYERDTGSTKFGDIFKARGRVEAFYLGGGFEILAPWGETQVADQGYLLLNGDEVYGNAKETFERTYRIGG